MNNTIYSEADYTAIVRQQKKRWAILAIPCVLLLAVLIVSLIIRLEWLSVAATILIGVLLIAGYDLAIKPLHRYQVHLKNCIYGRTRECELPFVSLSENIDVVEGVRYRQLLCADIDAKGRPYERLFYFDAEKQLPSVQKDELLHIVHHDLFIADIRRA